MTPNHSTNIMFVKTFLGLLTWLLNLFKPEIRPWLEASQHECSNYEMVKSEAMCAPFNIYQLLDACQYLFVPCLLVYS